VNARRLLFGIIVLGLLLAAAIILPRSGTAPASRPGMAQAQGGDPPQDGFRPLWSHTIRQLRSASISADSSLVSMVSGNGFVSLWRVSGARAWTRKVLGATKSLVSSDGEIVIAYADLDPTHQSVTFLRGATGEVIQQEALDGAIWDASLSSDGRQAAFLTGHKALYVFTLRPRPAFNRVPLDGIGNTVAFSKDGRWRTVGTWNQCGVVCYDTLNGGRWQYPGPADPTGRWLNRSFESELSQNGRYVLGLSYVNARRSSGVLYLWDTIGNGRPKWSHALKPETFRPKALISDNGKYIAVNYDYRISNGDRSVIERKLLVLDGEGQPLFPEKGGAIFSPVLVSLAPDGHRVTATDGQRTIVHISTANGRFTAHLQMDHLIHETVPSDDGRLLLVYTGDELVHLFRLS
jgi:hypothetical protein